MNHDHKLKGLKEIKNITKKRKSYNFFFLFEEYNVCQTWYEGKVDQRNEGIGVSLIFFKYFFSVNTIF